MVLDITAPKDVVERIYPWVDLHSRKKESNREDSAETERLDSLPTCSQALHDSSICH